MVSKAALSPSRSGIIDTEINKYRIAADAAKILHGEKGKLQITKSTSFSDMLVVQVLFGLGELTIIIRRLIVLWLLLVYCFAGNQAGKKSAVNHNFSHIHSIKETDFNQHQFRAYQFKSIKKHRRSNVTSL